MLTHAHAHARMCPCTHAHERTRAHVPSKAAQEQQRRMSELVGQLTAAERMPEVAQTSAGARTCARARACRPHARAPFANAAETLF
jgi:hypothetical protein